MSVPEINRSQRVGAGVRYDIPQERISSRGANYMPENGQYGQATDSAIRGGYPVPVESPIYASRDGLPYNNHLEVEFENSVLESPPVNKKRLKDRVIDFVKDAIEGQTGDLQRAVLELTGRLDEVERERDEMALTLTAGGPRTGPSPSPADTKDQDQDDEEADRNEKNDTSGEKAGSSKVEKKNASDKGRKESSSSSSEAQTLQKSEHNFVTLLAEFTMERRRHARRSEEYRAEIARLTTENLALKQQVARQLDYAFEETKKFTAQFTDQVKRENDENIRNLRHKVSVLKRQLHEARKGTHQ